MNRYIRKKESGISIVALVITIILLLILSTVSIQAITGSGLFEQAKQAKVENKRGQVKENLNLNLMSAQAEKADGTAHDIVDLAHSILSTDEKIKSLKEIGKNVEIDAEIKNEEDYKPTDWYFYVTVDGDRYKVSKSGVICLGKIKDLGPAIKITEKSNTSSTITVKVETQRNEGGKLQYYIKDASSSDYKLIKESNENTYTYEKLNQGIKYSIKVVAVAKNKKKAEVTCEQTTGEVLGLKEKDISFSAEPSTMTNKDVTVTAKANIDIGDYYLTTSTDGKKWDITDNQTFSKNGRMYVILSDGTNYGKSSAGYTVTNIDKLAPVNFTPQITAKTTNSITVNGTTTDAEKTEDNASSGIKGYRFSIDGGNTYTKQQSSPIYKFEGLSQTKEYTIKVEAEDNAGNTTVGTANATTEAITSATGATYSPTTWTNGNVKVTLPTKSGFTTVYTKDGSAPTKSSTKYSAAFEVSGNCKVNYLYTDGTNIGGAGTLNINNIDKNNIGISKFSGTPSTTIASTSTLSTTVNDTNSGLSTIVWQWGTSTSYGKSSTSTYTNKNGSTAGVKGDVSKSISINELSPNTKYYAKITVYDVAGNSNTSTTSFTTKAAVAQVGSTYYTSAQNAVNSISSSGTVKLVNNTTEIVEIASGKNITLDLNGKTITGKIKNNGTLILSGGTVNGSEQKYEHGIENNGTATINSGTYKGYYQGVINYKGTTTIKGGTFYGSQYDGVLAKTGTVNISNGTFSGGHSGAYSGTTSGTLKISGGTFTSGSVGAIGSDGGEVIVTAGTFKGVGAHAFYSKAGNIYIKGGTFTTTTEVDAFTVKAGTVEISGGSITGGLSGFAINSGKVTVTGGTFRGNKYNGFWNDTATVYINGGNFSGKNWAIYSGKGKLYYRRTDSQKSDTGKVSSQGWKALYSENFSRY